MKKSRRIEKEIKEVVKFNLEHGMHIYDIIYMLERKYQCSFDWYFWSNIQGRFYPIQSNRDITLVIDWTDINQADVMISFGLNSDIRHAR